MAQIWACARSLRIAQLVSALLRRAARSSPRWSTVAPNGGRSRQPAVGVGGRSATARPAAWIAAGVPRLPLSGALGLKHRACQRDDNFHEVRVFAGNKMVPHPRVLTELRQGIILNKYSSTAHTTELRCRITYHTVSLYVSELLLAQLGIPLVNIALCPCVELREGPVNSPPGWVDLLNCQLARAAS